MKCKIPEISWHNRDPVLSVDIQPNKANGGSPNNYRLASGGTDAHVLIWYMKMTSGENSDIELDLAADLTRHQRAVNVVKWSPNGELLASGDDESVVFIWKLRSDSEPINVLDPTNEQDKEVWITLKVLRGHMEDIYDLSWAPNSLFLVSGSVDNSAMMWDVIKGKSTAILSDHKGFVQGVAWDPKNQYIATLSTDRYLRIFDIQSKKVLHRISKGSLPVSEDHNLHGRNMRLFHDDTLQTFFRRLCFSPDGKLLLTPAGVTDYDGCTHPLNTTYAFSRYGFRQPAIVLPCPDQYTVAVRCCPLLYRLRPHDEEKNPPVVPLPYRMIFAVATKSSVYFYDTQQKQPFALISNIHYTRLTDITWSQDGLVVVVSSTDGFCSLITFEKGELGEEYEDSDAVLEAALAQVNAKNGKPRKQKENDYATKSRKPSMDNNNQAKENATIQNETVLENIEEIEKQSITGIEIKTNSSKKDEKEHLSGDKSQNSDKQANPIAIKRKPERQVATLENDKEATPIVIKRKPRASLEKVAVENPANPIAIKHKPGASLTAVEDPAKPIAIKRKPGPESKQEDAENTKEHCSTAQKPAKAVIPSNVLTAEIILDKEILSSDEKFESPEKKSRPATPISVRRHPRTPSQTPTQVFSSPTSFSKIITPHAEQPTPASPTGKQAKEPHQGKKATPIAVRRKPRTLITTPSVDNTPTMVEEAMDAWPTSKGPDSEGKESPEKSVKRYSRETGVAPIHAEETSDRTEDIRLVYEDTVEEAPPTSAKETIRSISAESAIDPSTTTTESKCENDANPETPNGKTPRRVALKTISTPKSKKKLMD